MAWEEEEMGSYLMGVKCQFCEMEKLWRLVTIDVNNLTLLNSTLKKLLR